MSSLIKDIFEAMRVLFRLVLDYQETAIILLC